METSALDQYIRRQEPRFDLEAYHAALQSDWERGRPEEIAEYDCRMGLSGGIIRAGGFEGYVGTLRFDGTPLTDFRSIQRSPASGFREVYAKDVDGVVWHVGKIKRPGGLPGPSRRWGGD